MSWRIVFLLLEAKLDSNKNSTTTELHEDVSRYAVASVYELDRKHVLINNYKQVILFKRNFHK